MTTTRAICASASWPLSRPCAGWTTSSSWGCVTTPPDAVRSAAVELLREYRVDGPASSAEVETVVHQIAELVGKAHDTLVDPASRDRYQAELGPAA